jgi:hypothetical protein
MKSLALVKWIVSGSGLAHITSDWENKQWKHYICFDCEWQINSVLTQCYQGRFIYGLLVAMGLKVQLLSYKHFEIIR